MVILVSNNGRPISLELQEEMFVPFYTCAQDGRDMGLSLSRQIMRLRTARSSWNAAMTASPPSAFTSNSVFPTRNDTLPHALNMILIA